MDVYFEKVKGYEDINLLMPERKTSGSAGYDFAVAEDTVIPSYYSLMEKLKASVSPSTQTLTLDEMSACTKVSGAKPTLVPTGIKCHMNKNQYLEISVRSSCPLKSWLVMANGSGKIDSDYYGNSSNDGHIFFQMINLSPFDIILHKNDIIGQGIIYEYCTTDDDNATGKRTGGFGSTSVKNG